MQASKITIDDVIYAVRLGHAQGFDPSQLVRAKVKKIVSVRKNNGAPDSTVYVKRVKGFGNFYIDEYGDLIAVEPDQVLDEARRYEELEAQKKREVAEQKAAADAAEALRNRVADKLGRLLGVPVQAKYSDGVAVKQGDLPAAEAAIDRLLAQGAAEPGEHQVVLDALKDC